MSHVDGRLPDLAWFSNCTAPSTLRHVVKKKDVPVRMRWKRKSSHVSNTSLLTPPSSPDSDSNVTVIDFSESPDKPPFSYAELITMAIESTREKRILLADIYRFVETNFGFYRMNPNTWKNSIRHNLSLNRKFAKDPDSSGKPVTVKGSFWTFNLGEQSVISSPATASTAEACKKIAGLKRKRDERPESEERTHEVTTTQSCKRKRSHSSSVILLNPSSTSPGDHAYAKIHDDALPSSSLPQIVLSSSIDDDEPPPTTGLQTRHDPTLLSVAQPLPSEHLSGFRWQSECTTESGGSSLVSAFNLLCTSEGNRFDDRTALWFDNERIDADELPIEDLFTRY